jgi:hypothetical protein
LYKRILKQGTWACFFFFFFFLSLKSLMQVEGSIRPQIRIRPDHG